MDIAQEMLATFKGDSNLLKKVITGDKSQMHGYDIETKAQSSQWKRPEKPRPKKGLQVQVKCKGVLRFQWRGAS